MDYTKRHSPRQLNYRGSWRIFLNPFEGSIEDRFVGEYESFTEFWFEERDLIDELRKEEWLKQYQESGIEQ